MIAILLLPSKPLFFAPPFLICRLRSSGEFLRGHGSEMVRVLVQSAAEFPQHLQRLFIAGCRSFCAQLTDPVFESAARHQVYESANPYQRMDYLLFRTAERFQNKSTAGSVANVYSCAAVVPSFSPGSCVRFQHPYTKHVATGVNGSFCSTNHEILNTGQYRLSCHDKLACKDAAM